MVVYADVKFQSFEYVKKTSYTTKAGEEVEKDAYYKFKFLVVKNDRTFDNEQGKILESNTSVVQQLRDLNAFEDLTIRMDIQFLQFGKTEAHEIEILNLTRKTNQY